MAISVAVPKDLSGIKTKVAFNLTLRQIVCFASAAAAGGLAYFLTRGVLGTSVAAMLMVAAGMPFFLLAMYTKEGFPAEKVIMFKIRHKMRNRNVRPYRSENIYECLDRREKIKEEIRYLEEKQQRGRKRD